MKEEELEEIYNPDIDFSKKQERGVLVEGQNYILPSEAEAGCCRGGLSDQEPVCQQQKHLDGTEDEQHKISIILFVKRLNTKTSSGI